MGLFQSLRRAAGVALAGKAVRAQLQEFASLRDPKFLEAIRGGGGFDTHAGAIVSPERAMRATAVNASVRLLACATAMLPLHLIREIEEGKKEKARNLRLYTVLYRRPNRWQTSFQFRAMLTAHMLLRGNGYAMKVSTTGGSEVQQLIPLHPDRMEVEQKDNLSLIYRYTRHDGREVRFSQDEIFHLADWYTTDGFKGKSRIAMVRESIGWALKAQEAGARVFRHGVLAGGALKTANKLSEPARENIQKSLEEKYAGGENAGKWLVLEEGLEPAQIGMTAQDAQFIETMNFQVVDIARVYGVPPHLIGAVEKTTSWGSGIQEQSIGFVQYSAQPLLTSWEQAIIRDLIPEKDADTLYPKHNMGALLRGSAKDRAEYLAKALGSGGHRPWFTQNDAREYEDMNKSDDPDADRLIAPGATDQAAGGDDKTKDDQNEQAQAA